MDISALEIKCKPYRTQYKHLFGYVPCYGDYEASPDEFFYALSKSVIERKPIYEILTVKREPNYRAFLPVEDYFESRMNEVLMRIYRKQYNNETYIYAYNILKAYLERQDEIVNYVVSVISKFYSTKFTPEEIKEKLGRPQIEISDANSGIIVWANHKLDEYVINCEFVNDLFPIGVSIDG